MRDHSMSPERRAELLLVDIVERADVILDAMEGIDEVTFRSSELHRGLVLWSLTVVGEAANRLPAELTSAHPNVPWSRMVGFRNLVVHTYENIDAAILWTTIEQIRPVRQSVFAILRSEYPLVAEAMDQRARED